MKSARSDDASVPAVKRMGHLPASCRAWTIARDQRHLKCASEYGSVQRAVVAVTQEAIRVCGGRAFLKRYPLERYARDARAAALMRPWTQEIAMQQAWEAALGLDGQRGGAAGA